MKKIHWKQLIIRIVIYTMGLFIMAFGAALAVNSNLGISPVNSIPYALSLILNRPLGTCATMFFSVCIAVQILILRKQTNPIIILQMVFATIYGYFLNYAKGVLGSWVLPGYIGRFTMQLAGIVMVAFGIFLLVEMRLTPMPTEGLCITLADETGVPFPKMKVMQDVAMVCISALLSALSLHGIYGIREGTVLNALITGRIIAVFKKYLSPGIQKRLYD